METFKTLDLKNLFYAFVISASAFSTFSELNTENVFFSLSRFTIFFLVTLLIYFFRLLSIKYEFEAETNFILTPLEKKDSIRFIHFLALPFTNFLIFLNISALFPKYNFLFSIFFLFSVISNLYLFKLANLHSSPNLIIHHPLYDVQKLIFIFSISLFLNINSNFFGGNITAMFVLFFSILLIKKLALIKIEKLNRYTFTYNITSSMAIAVIFLIISVLKTSEFFLVSVVTSSLYLISSSTLHHLSSKSLNTEFIFKYLLASSGILVIALNF